MSKLKAKKPYLNHQQLERQRIALRERLYRILDELEGRPTDWRSYSPFPYGALEKVIEDRLEALEVLISRLLMAIEQRISKPKDK